MLDATFPIPELRQDLKIYKGGFDKDGSPTWMIYDPISDNYYKVGWFEFECLIRLEKTRDMDKLAALVSEETTLSPEKDDILDFVMFLITNNLCQGNDLVVQNFQLNRDQSKNSISLSKLFVKFVYFQIPLFKPDRFLKICYPFVSVFLTKQFFIFMMCLLLAGLFLTIQRIDHFLVSFTNFTSVESIVLILVTTIFVKIIHELGHAFVAYKHKVPVTTIGVALIILYPILYTETTNSWKLFERKKRIQITMAGVMAELYLAAIALILWHILPPGLPQNTAFFVAAVSLMASVLINGNPLMKFDGYYLASDLSAIDNLQFRAIDFFKWKLREILFVPDQDPPEYFDEKTERFLVLFGVALVIYRFFLFLGIALLMYHFLMKPLNTICMLLEIYIFIAFPILKELKTWYTERSMLFAQKRPKYIIFSLLFLLIVMFFPINRTVSVPAVIHAEQYTSLYPVNVSEVKEIHVQNGDVVKQGDVLFVLSSPVLEKKIKTTKSEILMYKAMLDRETLSMDGESYDVVFEEKIKESETKLDGLLKQKEALVVTAEHDGRVQDIGTNIHQGRWVHEQTLLAHLIDVSGVSVSGYISERDVSRLTGDVSGYFRSDSAILKKIPVSLSEELIHNTRAIRHQELASIYGGRIAADAGANNEVISKETLYLAQFSVSNDTEMSFSYTEKGVLTLKATSQIPILIFSKKILSLLVHEVNF